MADWPKFDGSRFMEDDTAGASYGVDLGTAGGANAKGAYQELFASCPFDTAWAIMEMQIDRDVSYLVDIAVGAGGSEQVIIPNIPFGVVTGAGGSAHGFVNISLPIAISRGQRIAARMQAANSGTPTRRFKLHLLAEALAGIQAPSRWIDWGTVLATSGGTVVTGGAVNTKGAYSQLVAATDFATRWILFSILNGTIDDITIDLAVGAGGLEQVLLPDIHVTNEHMVNAIVLPCSIRKGERLAGRLAAAGGASTVELAVLGGA